ncbi:ECF transporter S component [Lentilactobacillus senioris]|uniref:ECF transporter S component n=1 Tax=Lentilactobacillus senioris TaxID=931534 RepID=UPI0022809C55|nr:ECF transporter S component [Lentilactobacillus senioris]MCY9806811.1 ECF transporter S component [Lentilactobacillus senioris]
MERHTKGLKHSFVTADIVRLAVLAGSSYVLMFFAFPVIPLVSYMKIDFSDMPVLIATVITGPLGGIIVAGVKSLLYWITTGASIPNLIGVGSSFISSIVIVEAFYYSDKYLKNFKRPTKITVTIFNMAVSLAIVMSILNWLVVTPLYMNLLGLKISIPIAQLVLTAVVPFNLIKGILVGLVFIFVRQRVLPRLKIKE